MYKDEELHRFNNLQKFSTKLAKFVARTSGYTFKELKAYIRPVNVKNIVKKHAKFVDDHYVMTEDQSYEACEEILDWLVGVELAKLAADDVLDCYWDDESNQMVFKAKSS